MNGHGDASDVVVVLCTAPTASARTIADTLLQERLLACANLIGPLRSRYRWQGKVEEAEEMLLLMKTTRGRAAELRARLLALHPYQVPELLEFGVAGGLPAYLAWVAAAVAAPPAEEAGGP